MTQALSPRELDRLREAAAAMNSALNNTAIEAVTASLPKVDLSAISEGLGATAALRTMAAVTPKFDTSVVSVEGDRQRHNRRQQVAPRRR